MLVYDNAKADRLGRRLPISEATAAVITGQQDRVRAMFPHTPAAELALLPTPRRNPLGRTPISVDMLDGPASRSGSRPCRHRAPATGSSSTKPGSSPMPTGIAMPNGKQMRVCRSMFCAELLDHRSYSVTRGYYRVGEDRQPTPRRGRPGHRARLQPAR